AEVESLARDAWVVDGEDCAVVPLFGSSPLMANCGEERGTAILQFMHLPYVRQLLASFNVSWGNVWLLRLAPGARYSRCSEGLSHGDGGLHLHIPIIAATQTKVVCAGEAVYME